MPISGIKRLFHLERSGRRVDAEIDDELRFHFDMTVGDLLARGLSEQDARDEAARRFGDINRTRAALRTIDRQQVTQARRAELWDIARQDVRYAIRALRRSPGFAIGILLTFGLAIGANAAMFGIVDRLLLRSPAHVSDADRLRRVYLTKTNPGGGDDLETAVSYPEFADVSRNVRAFSGMAAVAWERLSLGRGAGAEQVRAAIVTASFFPLLGVRPAMGRFFSTDEDRAPLGAPVAVISYGFWRDRLAGDPGVVGRRLHLGKTLYTVVGVAPKEFTGVDLEASDVWLPISVGGLDAAGDSWFSDRGNKWLEIIGRLGPAIGDRRADGELTAVYRRTQVGHQYSDTSARLSVAPVIMQRGPRRAPETRVSAWLAGVAAVVLLVACANVANLLLARGMRRQREIAVRLALGVSRARLASQLVTETMLLAVGGGLLGLLLAHWAGALARSVLLPDISWPEGAVDGRVLAFAGAAVALTGLVTGVLPAVQAQGTRLGVALKVGTRDLGRRRSTLRTSLLVTQAALSVVLLVGAGLFVRSLRNVRAQDLGFDYDRLLVASLRLGGLGYSKDETHALYERALERVRTLPGVERATLAISTPFASSYALRISAPGVASIPRLASGGTYVNGVSPDYFVTMGTRIVRGRAFTSADRGVVPPSAVVNETMARLVWPGLDPIGRCVKLGDDTLPCTTVVGVAQDVYRQSIRPEPTMQFYIPLDPRSLPTPMRALFVRATGDPDRLVSAVRREVQSLAPSLPYANVRPMRRLVDPHVRSWTLGAAMFSAFGLLALLIAAVGLYSVIAYDVAQRTAELGVRVALGARAADVLRLVVGQAARVAMIGVATGVMVALAAARWVAPLLFDVSPRDPFVFSGVAMTLLIVATAASLGPARRAARVDPAVALRSE
jgi:predicted permease